MPKNNRKIKIKLKAIYGDGCFFERAHCAEKIERIGGIKTYKKFVQEKIYKGQPISLQLTYHHLRHKSEGGEATIENGANVKEIAHQYLHSLPREQEEIVNNMIREFKIDCLTMSGEGELIDKKSIEFPSQENDFLVIPLYNNNEKYNKNKAIEQEKTRQRLNQEKKIKRLKNPTRAMLKEDLNQRILEDLDEERE